MVQFGKRVVHRNHQILPIRTALHPLQPKKKQPHRNQNPHPARALSPLDRALRAASVPSRYDDLYPSQARASSRALSPLLGRGLRAASLAPLDSFLSEYDDDVAGPAVSSLSPTPVKSGRWGPRASEVAYNPEGKCSTTNICKS